MYKISVIIPVYNVSEYLESCIKSLQKQTIGFESLEIIMVDDCSTDQSSSIMKNYETIYNNIKCIYLTENSGAAGKPRNEALKMVTADYVMFLDPDDEYYDNACEMLFQTIKKYDADCVSGYYSIFENGIILVENMHEKNGIKEGIYYVPENIDIIADFQIHLACKIYKKRIIKYNNVLFPEKIIGEDTVFVWRYLCNVKNVYYISHPILKYKQRKEENKSKSYILTHKYFEETCIALELIGQCFLEKGYKDKVKYGYRDTNNYFIEQLINSKLKSKNIKELLQKWGTIVGENTNIINTNPYTNIVLDDIITGDKDSAAKKIILLQEIKSYSDELLNSKIYFENKFYSDEAEIKKLRQWIDEIISGKSWVESQYKIIKKEYDELQNWCNELEQGKDWVENQYKIIKEEYDKLQNWCNELQQGKDWLENEWKNKCRECKELKEAFTH